MTPYQPGCDHRTLVPMFPLPNVVLLPRAVLPLHVFEERYRQMVAEVLRGEHRMAMALLRPGWEKAYHRAPAIEPVVCVGRVLSHERLADGRYNLLLQGEMRARVVREVRQSPYRVAEVAALEESNVLEIDLLEYRQRLAAVLTQGALGPTGIGQQAQRLLESAMPTADVADVMAFNLVDDLALKQALLGEADVARRVACVVKTIERLVPLAAAAVQRDDAGPSLN